MEYFGDSMKSFAQRRYKFATDGVLDDGLTYEDFSARDGEIVSAIRCHFDGDELKKIAFAAYSRENSHIHAGKCIVKILAFTDSPDKNLLSLPAGLTDTTKR
ncbi:MAG: hypothetical protein SR1Q7_02765 [Quinella sp. 1Q7]|nr:hypothetical protein [Quinella sp. 1Q7]